MGHESDQLSDVADGRQWMCVLCCKDCPTPTGMDVFSRHPDGLTEQLFTGIKEEQPKLNNPQLRELAAKLYEVRRYGAGMLCKNPSLFRCARSSHTMLVLCLDVPKKYTQAGQLHVKCSSCLHPPLRPRLALADLGGLLVLYSLSWVA